MRRHIRPVALVFLLVFTAAALAQVVNATLSGTVSDSGGALIPGVEVNVKNTDTGVVSTAVTNETGTYRFPSLQPGRYEASASLPGFQTQTFQLTLGTSQQIRRNFILQIGTIATSVDVTTAADQALTTSVQSVAGTLPQRELVNLPLVGRNVMRIATLATPGVIGTGGTSTTFAGISARGSGNVNIQVDGMTVNNGRHEAGLSAATNINPDMVEEVRLVVAAVDVEARGSAQFQVRTRSGTNEFHGSGTWNVLNSVLNANSWSNNRLGITKTWFNRHQYTASVGGPIKRNKTFFFALFDGQKGLAKQNVDAPVLTATARQGIYRFFPGVNSGNADASVSGSGITRTAPVVDASGNPLDPTRIPGATGPMQSFSVFGDALNPGDPSRRSMDPTGFMARLIKDMPLPNAFDGTLGDGLNLATHRWVRRTVALVPIGVGGDPDSFNRKQINVKIDHHFNQDHRLTGSYSREHRFSDNNQLSPWPNGWNGAATTDPAVYALQFTSVLSPNILNEFRYGRRVTTLEYVAAYHHSVYGKQAWDYMPVRNGIPVLVHPTLFESHMINCSGYCAHLNNKSPLSTFTDTLSWTRGEHAMKFGAEFRFANTVAAQPNVVIPHIYGGAGDVPVRGIDTITGLLPNNQTMAQNVLLSLSGSVNDSRQRFEIREPSDNAFLDFRNTYAHPDNPKSFYGRIRDWHQNEVNFFVKDDWRVTPTFTLNMGIRYDLMRVPYLLSAKGRNFTPALLGGNSAAFGYSGRSFSDWMSGGSPLKGDLTKTVLVGEGTPYPDQGIWKSDRNNWAPAVGFAWAPNWFGQDRTSIRGGYQIAYQLPGRGLVGVDLNYGNLPGFFYEPTDLGNGSFRDLSNTQIPLAVNQKPFEAIPITQRAQILRVVDADFATPYVQTFTIGVTQALARNMTLDVKYVGTRGVRLEGSFNLNAADFRNNGLFEALQITRAGGNAPLFDRMLKGLNIGSGVVGTAVSGSEALRQHASTRTNIANGNFAAVAEFLNTTNAGTVQPPLTNGGLLRSSGSFPENFIAANPQFSQVIVTTADNSIYHSLQTQMTLRPTRGIQYLATYTWSKSLGVISNGVAGFTDPTNAFADYTVQPTHRSHAFRSYGTFELPFGPNRFLGGRSSGWVARLIEGWQLGAIVNLTSGAPLTVVGGNTLYSNGRPDIVSTFPRRSETVWEEGERFGNFFSQQYQRVQDPQCGGLASILTRWCTINALADANGNIVLQHPGAGKFGSLGLNTLDGPGSWDLDMNIQKSVRIHEARALTFRMDAQNIFNHPTPGNPNLNMNSGTFGQITTKSGERIVQAQLRFEF